MESNILFCHIPKCSGTSINDALKKNIKIIIIISGMFTEYYAMIFIFILITINLQ